MIRHPHPRSPHLTIYACNGGTLARLVWAATRGLRP